jgi:hypothetical protein
MVQWLVTIFIAPLIWRPLCGHAYREVARCPLNDSA